MPWNSRQRLPGNDQESSLGHIQNISKPILIRINWVKIIYAKMLATYCFNHSLEMNIQKHSICEALTNIIFWSTKMRWWKRKLREHLQHISWLLRKLRVKSIPLHMQHAAANDQKSQPKLWDIHPLLMLLSVTQTWFEPGNQKTAAKSHFKPA